MTHLMKGLRLPHLMKQIRAACSSATDESSIPATTILCTSVNRLDDLLDIGQLFKAFGNN